MRRLVRSLLLVAVVGRSASAIAGDDPLPASVAAALQRAQIPENAVGLVVQRAGPDAGARGTSTTLLSVHPDRVANPASTMKLVTTYAALELLGPAFTWKTVLATAGRQTGTTLDGDLVLRGAGDPKLVVEDLWSMLRQLRARGIRTIRGDVVLDRSLFEAVPFDPAAFDGEPFRPYNVGPDALLVNFKAVVLRFVPDDAARQVRVSMEPALAGFESGSVAYVDGACGDWKTRAGADFSRPDRLVFAGGYPGSCGEQTWNVSVLDHRGYVSALFRSLWAEMGGVLDGTVREGLGPPDARVLVEHVSPSVSEVVRDINKYSNNVMARELFLSLAAEAGRVPANVDGAQQVVRGFYASRGVSLPDLVLENGSGLSRRERISPQSLARVLQAAWASPVMPEFVASLPLVGFDGTMRKRLVQRSVAGQAHIKTGSLADARAMAGYVLAGSGRYYVVVVLVNHPNAGAGQAAQDALLQWVHDNG